MLANADWDDLRCFLAVADTGSLKAAAKSARLSQPTLGRRLGALEAAMGVALFVRSRRGCRLTTAGERLLPVVREMHQSADAVELLRSQLAGHDRGKVRIATGALVARWLIEHHDTVFEGLPPFDMEVLPGNHFVALERGEADLAIRTRLPEGSHWVQRRLRRTSYTIFASPHFVETHPEAKSDARYSTCPFVAGLETTPSGRWLQQKGAHVAFRLGSSLLVIEAAARHHGLALLPTYAGDSEPRLTRVSDVVDLELQGYLVMHPEAQKRTIVRQVARALADRLFVEN